MLDERERREGHDLGRQILPIAKRRDDLRVERALALLEKHQTADEVKADHGEVAEDDRRQDEPPVHRRQLREHDEPARQEEGDGVIEAVAKLELGIESSGRQQSRACAGHFTAAPGP